MPVTGFINGVFDLLHRGHRYLLDEAHAQCDRLIIGLNTDDSARILKGENRPIWDEERRIGALCQHGENYPFMIANEAHLRATIEAINPDVVFRGWDQKVEPWLTRYVIIIPRLEGYSTTCEIAKSRA